MLIVEGGHRLRGEVRVPGFKHALVTVVAAAVVGHAPVTVDNCPNIEDTRILIKLLRALGADAHLARGALHLDPTGLADGPLDPILAGRIHGSVYLLPGLLARFGQVSMPSAGGCRIGDSAGGLRPVEQYADVLRRFGARVLRGPDGSLTVRADSLVGCDLDLRRWTSDPTLRTGPLYSGATKMAILTAAAARGTTRLRCPYPKPDVTELVGMLCALGYAARYASGGDLLIEGRQDGGHGRPVRHTLISDLITVVTYATVAPLTGSPIRLTGLTLDRLGDGLAPEIAVARAMGLDARRDGADSLVLSGEPPRAPVNITVASHGVYSDSQPFLCLLATLAPGTSRIRETVWKQRFGHVPQLRRLGARIESSGAEARITGPHPPHRACNVTAGDLRAAAALLVAALAVPGEVRLDGAAHLVRGYEDLVGDLHRLGAHIRAVPDGQDADGWTVPEVPTRPPTC